MHYLSREEILRIHATVISETGGSHGVRDHHAIATLEHLPRQAAFGAELYPTIHLKAAVYIRNIITAHPFIDGNKRTGMTIAGVFLELNGAKIIVKEGGVEDFALRVIAEKLPLEEIAGWLKKHSRKIMVQKQKRK